MDVVNLGVSGDTSAGGVRRLDAALAERPHILIVAFGSVLAMADQALAAAAGAVERLPILQRGERPETRR